MISVLQQLESSNIAEELDGKELSKIGGVVFDGYQIDKSSRKDWEERNESYIKLAAQVAETKNFPWPKAANVKYPLLSVACLQFAARAHQQLFPGPNVVKAKVIGFDPQGLKRSAAERISKHMSYQLLDQMEDWEDDMDRLTLVLPICGNVFKKTYRAPGVNVSELVLPNDLVVNYFAKSLEKASRKTHVLFYYANEIEERFRSGEWVRPEKPFGEAPVLADSAVKSDVHGVNPPATDPDAPHRFLEQHTFYDLDEDGYKEPVIITIHEATQFVVRIVARYEPDDVEFDVNGKDVIKIVPVEYFTNFRFIPDATSGVYGQGFGGLLGPLNEAANSAINQLLDAGTLSNLQCGFLSRGVRMAAGNKPLRPGEFRTINVPGDDIRKGVFPLPIKEPSGTLFQMLGMMLESGQSLSAVSDMMTGKSPGQNQPHATTTDVLQQGLQVFSSIYKRIHRSLKKEYRKLFELNRKYVGETEYFTILDSDQAEQGSVNRVDYLDESMDVVPASDPTIITNQEKLQTAEGLVGFVQMGTVNPMEATRRILEARGVEDINKLMEMPPPQPDPKIVLEQEKLKLEAQRIQGEQQIAQLKSQYQALRDQTNSELAQAKARHLMGMLEIERLKAENQAIKDANTFELNKFTEEMRPLIEKYKADKSAQGRASD